MNTIIEAVNSDWATLVSRMKLNGNEAELRDNVHSALGALIKQRKVYYTGNKGYFLVGPDGSVSTNSHNNNGTNASNGGCTSLGLFGSHGLTTSALGSKFSHLRHSMRERSSSSTNGSPNHSPGKLQNCVKKLRQVCYTV